MPIPESAGRPGHVGPGWLWRDFGGNLPVWRELKTYSPETIRLLLAYTEEAEAQGRNLALENLENMVQSYGYSDLKRGRSCTAMMKIAPNRTGGERKRRSPACYYVSNIQDTLMAP